MADGSTDSFYLKLTTPKQKSLIIGSSRAAQGLQPEIINEVIEGKELYNFAFSRVHTPYGEPYFKSVQKKVQPNVEDGLFVLEVNPWVVSEKENEQEIEIFYESRGFLGKVNNVDLNPNFEYLIESFGKRYIDIISNKFVASDKINVIVQSDGWCKVSLPDAYDQKKVKKSTLERYQLIQQEYKGVSDKRMKSLIEIVNYLKAHGTVILIRLPVCDDMLEIENKLIPDFDGLMSQVAKKMNIKYINTMPLREQYLYSDGHHLETNSSMEFSKYLATLIKKTL